MAFLCNQAEVVRVQLDCGARIDLADWKGDAPLPLANSKKNYEHSGNGGKRCCHALQALLKAEKSRNTGKSIHSTEN